LPDAADLVVEVLLEAALAVLEWVEGSVMARKMGDCRLVTNVVDPIISLETVTPRVSSAMLAGNLKDIS